ncbi:hypothetical protein [Dyella caseinilytica]|uniref:Uncharacterized protein n=1 Tax=Dyella caseinilytica TaxID=1849581 RepID=A0ABX7GZR4_9GAMM|nr:hypothetical protein [Dyella caseinilytica]QRN55314.1 hypothetical protein ISN74_08305 [Dyella caseinilytica]
MNTAIVYILTSLTLAIITMVARDRAGNQQLGGEFRYQSTLLKVLLVCSFIPILAVAFIYAVAKAKPSGIALALFVGGGLIGTALFLYGYRYLKSFVVSVNDSGVVVSSLKGERLIPFNGVKKVIYLCPSGRGGILCFYDERNRKVIEFSESISGIEGLAKLVELKSRQHGVLFEARSRRI